MATYRPRSDWLRQAIESVLTQTFANFELLVLDDSRLPSVLGIVRSYDDKRIRYLPGPGKGPGHNHAFGIREAAAPLVSIINHDDAWEPRMLERLVDAYRSVPNAVLAFADEWVADESGLVDPARSEAVSLQWKRTSVEPGVHRSFARIALIDGSIAIGQSAVFCRDVAGDLDPRSGQCYDRYLAYLLARTGRPAVYVPERLAVWRESPSNLTSNRSIKGSLTHLRLILWFIRDPELAELRQPLSRELLRSARGVLGSGWSVARAKLTNVVRRVLPRDPTPLFRDPH
jgi:glycosyltransferase involved in cell wall biosynthesis